MSDQFFSNVPPTAEFPKPDFDALESSTYETTGNLEEDGDFDDPSEEESTLSALECYEEIKCLPLTQESDCHIIAGLPPRVRNEKDEVVPLQVARVPISQEAVFELAEELCKDSSPHLEYVRLAREYSRKLVEQSRRPACERKTIKPPFELDGFDLGIEIPTELGLSRFRGHFSFCLAPTAGAGFNIRLRRILPEPWGPELIGVNSQCNRLVDEIEGGRLRGGLVLVVGSTNSGKSTFWTSLIEAINLRQSCHIITFEDPIEFRFISKEALISQHQIPQHIPDYSRAKLNAYRLDADIVGIHEMRVREAVEFALEYAKNGHLVLATMHADSTFDAVLRLARILGYETDPFPIIANNVAAIVYQKLLPPSPLLFDPYVSVAPNFKRRVLIQEVVRLSENEELQKVVTSSQLRTPDKWYQALGTGKSLITDSNLSDREISFEDALFQTLTTYSVPAVDQLRSSQTSQQLLARISREDAEAAALRKGYFRELIRTRGVGDQPSGRKSLS